jgi:hypothetical protein
MSDQAVLLLRKQLKGAARATRRARRGFERDARRDDGARGGFQPIAGGGVARPFRRARARD